MPHTLHDHKIRLYVSVLALYLALFVAALDYSIVSTALPTIASHFRSASAYTWVGSAYLLAQAASAPTWAKLSDIWGRKIVVLIALVFFFFGSMMCALASSMGSLIAGRVLQGASGGGVVVLVNVVVSDLFSLRERGLILGLSGIVWTIALGSGPFVGGLLTEKLSWRWIWWINLPFCGTAFTLLTTCLDTPNPHTPLVAGLKAVDWVGSATIVGFAVMLPMGLTYGSEGTEWSSSRVVALIASGMATLVLFLLYEAKLAKHPIMPLRIFATRSNLAALVVCFCHGFTYISAAWFLPLYCQSVELASPLRAGILLLPSALSQAALYLASDVTIWKTGSYLWVIWIGMVFMTLGMGMFIDFGSHFSTAKVITYQLVVGLGIGFVFEAPLVALQAGVSQRDVASATAAFGFLPNLATSVSIVVGGVVFQAAMERQKHELLALLDSVDAARLSSEAAASVMLLRELQGPALEVVQQAFAQALRETWLLYTVSSTIGLGASIFIDAKELSTVQTEVVVGLQLQHISRSVNDE
ncbi:hypothetical protein OHC33_011173 [Knufia fluminis]|uniref:Major facilitator superfamily (MFS) profile domain-containing protein n=1 Tax=Knufia fluminis TaxID=191047 RepID=A0AAN8ELU1_9EURO|nr:hypothetical protein OHC33_011173 [Knufia fluminis]